MTGCVPRYDLFCFIHMYWQAFRKNKKGLQLAALGIHTLEQCDMFEVVPLEPRAVLVAGGVDKLAQIDLTATSHLQTLLIHILFMLCRNRPMNPLELLQKVKEVIDGGFVKIRCAGKVERRRLPHGNMRIANHDSADPLVAWRAPSFSSQFPAPGFKDLCGDTGLLDLPSS